MVEIKRGFWSVVSVLRGVLDRHKRPERVAASIRGQCEVAAVERRPNVARARRKLANPRFFVTCIMAQWLSSEGGVTGKSGLRMTEGVMND